VPSVRFSHLCSSRCWPPALLFSSIVQTSSLLILHDTHPQSFAMKLIPFAYLLLVTAPVLSLPAPVPPREIHEESTSRENPVQPVQNDTPNPPPHTPPSAPPEPSHTENPATNPSPSVPVAYPYHPPPPAVIYPPYVVQPQPTQKSNFGAGVAVGAVAGLAVGVPLAIGLDAALTPSPQQPVMVAPPAAVPPPANVAPPPTQPWIPMAPSAPAY